MSDEVVIYRGCGHEAVVGVFRHIFDFIDFVVFKLDGQALFLRVIADGFDGAGIDGFHVWHGPPSGGLFGRFNNNLNFGE